MGPSLQRETSRDLEAAPGRRNRRYRGSDDRAAAGTA